MNYNILFTNLNSFAQNQGKKTFAQINGVKYSYQDLNDSINKLQSYFKENNFIKGDSVILSTTDDYYTSVLFLAFLKYGLATVFIDPELPNQTANALIKKTKPKAAFQDDNLNLERDTSNVGHVLDIKKEKQKKGKLFNRLLKSKKVESVDTNSFPALLNTLSPSLDISNISDSDTAYIIFTSGTTSEPKGVMISYKNVFTHLNTLKETYALNSDSNLLNILMLYHADGIIQGPLLALYNNASWYNPFKFEVSKLEDLFYAIYKYNITHFITVPTVLSFMNKFSEGYEDSFEHEDFKTVISVASKLETKLWTSFENKFNTTIVNVYGLTETVAGALFSGLTSQNRRIGSVGKAIDCQSKITDENNIEVANGTPGQLWLKGDHIFNNYLDDPITTASVFNDHWFNTGDVATQDCDGFITITGRLKNTINTGGVNIYPEQITEVINTHPDILESICFGVSDDFFGEKIACAIVFKSQKNTHDPNALLNFIRPLLHHHQVPKAFYFFSELPKGLSGKVQINKLLARVEEQDESNVQEVKDYNTSIFEAASTAFGLSAQDMTMEDNSTSIDGWDSMGHLLFITELEKQFKLQFSTSEIMRMNSFKTANLILKQKLSIHE